jgi:Radical SAM superfamily
VSLNRTIGASRAESPEEFFSLAGVPDGVHENVAALLEEYRLEPPRLARALAGATDRSPDDVIVAGPLERRVVMLRIEGDQWGALSVEGVPLDQISWPRAIRKGCRFEHPDRAISAIRLSRDAEFRLTRPAVHLVSLYHEENFPLPRFPLGISDLARAIRSAMTGQVRLSDMQLGTSLDQIVADLEAEPPDILGLSATFGQHDLLEELLGRIEAFLGPDGPLLVMGGSLTALNADLILKRYPRAIVARGAGEPTMIDVVEHWHGDREVPQIRNIRYSGPSDVLLTQKVGNREYDDIIPELDLLDSTLAHHGVMQLESSRGCTHACSFCPREHKGIWAGYEAGGIELLLRDIGPAYARHPEIARKIFLVDEEFIGHDRRGEALRRAVAVARTLKESGFRWETSSRVDQVFRPKEDAEWHEKRIEVWQTLLSNGLARCLFGVESGVDTILKRFNKHTTADQNAKAIRILTALDVPIRCTYITFDQLMTMDELVASYRFQGRRDMTMRPAPQLGAKELYDLVRDEDAVQPHLAGRPFYEHISYMLVSMECLLRSPYLKKVEQAGLARDILPAMGRRNAVFQDRRIGLLSDWSQRWVDHNFSLDYTLKSFEKVTLGVENEAVRRMRRVLKESAYTLLGRMLWLCLGDDTLLAEADETRAEFATRFDGGVLSGSDPEVHEGLLLDLLNTHLTELRERLGKEVQLISGTLSESRVRILDRSWNRWQNRSDWSLINSPEQCVAE